MLAFDIDLSTIPQRDYVPDPEKYMVTEELKTAVEVALRLQQPLLITGEPGTGKTQLAYKIAKDLSKCNTDFHEKPFVFNTKTTSTASDLFYQYDAIKHFYDANINKTTNEPMPHVSEYISLQALGKAIALSNIENIDRRYFLKMTNNSNVQDSTPKSSVVLIDEIDKAPRDFPNDLLNEIESLSFKIKEDSYYTIEKGENKNIVVIITSNSEKNLPDAFLRRCVFYYIPFPGEKDLLSIVHNHFKGQEPQSLIPLIKIFLDIRDRCLRKKPATAELIAWLKILEAEGFFDSLDNDFRDLSDEQKSILKISYPVLAKTIKDMEILEEMAQEA